MNYLKHCLTTAILLCLANQIAWAGDVKIIANASVGTNSITAAELKEVFLETRNSLADGSHLKPVLQKAGAAHEAFLRQYLDKSDAALQMYYRSLVFSGKGTMPKLAASDAEVIEYVAKTKGAIGYVSSDASTAGVKTLTVR